MAQEVILVVEDEAIFALHLQRLLVASGYQVPALVSNGEAAIQKVHELHPDLVLMDIQLPGKLNGIAAAQQILQTSAVPVVFLTAFHDEMHLQQALETNPNGYLVKPVRDWELIATIAVALNKNRAERQLQRNAARTEALARMAQRINTNLDLESLLSQVCEETAAVLNVPVVSVHLYDEARGMLAPAAYYGQPHNHLETLISLPPRVQAGLLENPGQVLVLSDLQMLSSGSGEDPVVKYTVVAAAFLVQSNFVGVLAAKSIGSGQVFSDEDLSLLKAFADHAAVAVRSAQLLEAERSQREEAEMIIRSGAVFSSSLDQSQVLETVLEELDRVIPFDSASIYLEESGELRRVILKGIDTGSGFRSHASRLESRDLYHEIQTSRQAVIVSNKQSEANFVDMGGAWLIQSVMAVPLVAQGKAIGGLLVECCQPAAYTNRQAELAQAFANQAAIALENARLYQVERSRVKKLAVLEKAARAFVSTLDMDEILTLVMDEARNLLQSEAATVLLYEEATDELLFGAVSGPAAHHLLGRRISASRGLAGWVLKNSRPVLICDVEQDPRFLEQVDRRTQLVTKSLVAVPLVYQGRTIGVIEVVNRLEGSYTEGDLELLSTLAGSAASSIENARLFCEVSKGHERLRELSYWLVEVQEAERRRLAAELNHKVTNSLAGFKMLLHQASLAPCKEVSRWLGGLNESANELLLEVNEMSLNLHPSMLDDMGLVPAINWYIGRCVLQSKTRISFQCKNLEQRFSPELETAVYRMVQEAMAQLSYHLYVDEVRISLKAIEHWLHLQVSAPGVMRDEFSHLSLEHRFSKMQDHAYLIGGHFSIGQDPEQGFYISVKFPMDEV